LKQHIFQPIPHALVEMIQLNLHTQESHLGQARTTPIAQLLAADEITNLH
jgi:hypothetical protein